MRPGLRFLVTGASGFIGYTLACRLAERHGLESVQLLVPPTCRHARERHRRDRVEEAGFRLVVHDLLTGELDPVSIEPFDVLFHLAAFTETETDSPLVRVNDVGTERLLRSLRPLLPGKRVVYTGSMASVDRARPDDTPQDESAPCSPRTIYGRTKLEAERILRRYAADIGFEWTILRLPTVYGPGFRPGGMFEHIARGLERGSLAVRLAWPGRMTLVYLDDVVEVLLTLATTGAGRNDLYHMAAGDAPRFDEVIEAVAGVLNVERRRIAPPRPFWSLVRRVVWLPKLLSVLPFRLRVAVWRISLVVTDGMVTDGARLERAVPRRHTPLAEGLAVQHAAHVQASPDPRLPIPAESTVLLVGCGTGELLAALRPSRGLGIDVRPELVRVARERLPGLRFEVAGIEGVPTDETFEHVVLAAPLETSRGVRSGFEALQRACAPETRVVVVERSGSRRPGLRVAGGDRTETPARVHEALSFERVCRLLEHSGFEAITKSSRVVLPPGLSFLSSLTRIGLAHRLRLPGFRRTRMLIARPAMARKPREDVTCSVVVPCRNEKANIEPAVLRIPEMGSHTEIIFVEGHSADGTLDECERMRREHPDKDIVVLTQDGIGKGDAVRKAFAHAKNDVLMILDADLTVPPEELPRFFEAIVSGRGELAIGSRFAQEMEPGAMRFLNRLGNRFFAVVSSRLLGQRIGDAFCGTKVLWREDYEHMGPVSSYLDVTDPFGDFDLLYGAARINRKVVEVPIRYRARTHGTTQIRRFRDGWTLFRITFKALCKPWIA